MRQVAVKVLVAGGLSLLACGDDDDDGDGDATIDYSVFGSCAEGEKMTGIDSTTGQVECAEDTMLSYSVFGSCAEGEMVTGVDAATGQVQCAGDSLLSQADVQGFVGDLTVTIGTGTGTLQELADLVADLRARVTLLEESTCPTGFSYMSESGASYSYDVCTRAFLGATDEMVKVGDFWIDRYEFSQCGADPGVLGAGPGNDTTAAACSEQGVAPLASITWFQATQLCENSGKHLCSNAEWQAAVAGTVDPVTGEDNLVGGGCHTAGSEVRATGLAGDDPDAGDSCISRWGAEDMVGNLWEWVGDWFVAGKDWQNDFPGSNDQVALTPWPAEYGEDVTWNVNGRSYAGVGWQDGVPAAALRGGSWVYGTDAGAFSVNLNASPADLGGSVGARCCVGSR